MKRADYLRLMEIDVWIERQQSIPTARIEAAGGEQPGSLKMTATQKIDNFPIIAEASTASVKQTVWEDLQQRVASCTACSLYKSRTQTVFGIGNRQANLMLIGEAPGAQEDRKGEPFVGDAGKLLNKILAAIQLSRDDVYITNILKSRPPDNREPQPNEIAACTPFLLEQIALIQPKLIVALGRIAAQYLLNTKAPLNKLRTQPLSYGKQAIPLIVTYHPAYLLRNPAEKRKAWEDWQEIKARLEILK